MGGRDHSCDRCGRGGFNDPDGACICSPDPHTDIERFHAGGDYRFPTVQAPDGYWVRYSDYLERLEAVEGERDEWEARTARTEAAAGERDRLIEGLRGLRKLVDRQAEDEGLWAVRPDIGYSYVQQELRRLHDAVESASSIREPEGEEP